MNERRAFPHTGDKTPFNVPDGYFEGLSAKMDQLIDQDSMADIASTNDRPRLTIWMDRYRPVLYLAAMFVLILFSVSTLLNLTNGKSSDDKLTKELSNEQPVVTAEDYVLSQIGTDGIAEYYIDPDMYD
jgi:signal transduction histidine kinase